MKRYKVKSTGYTIEVSFNGYSKFMDGLKFKVVPVKDPEGKPLHPDFIKENTDNTCNPSRVENRLKSGDWIEVKE